ncbi:MFS transporter, DHA2 family, multidrug resistance protein [Nonomuraea jiangxiensis]|uniref:MFS transporter, DHA2 family, multidrug resistance protein n=2 Tax=Nonomuraea jiangxiensis TaxID=633440 RepID=A0A1G9TN20_9ACTN|nr:MFS transporter, DHA2 family, multidrug resistance protein [Nonomuraea jiangxiensis]
MGLAVLALPTILLALDLTVLYMALPQLGAELGATNTQLLWITDIYGFMIAGVLITMGTLGDRVGRRRLLLIGATAFIGASVLAAYSTSPEMLIVSRALLGLAGATLTPSTLSLITNMFADPRQRSLAIGVWLTSFSVGGAIGPAVGGALLERFWWGSVFLLGVPVMVLLLVCGPALLPEYRNPGAGRLDLVSAVLSLAAILPVVYGVKQIAKDGPQAGPLLAVAAGLCVGVVFVRRQRTIPEPLLDLRLFGNRRFTGALVSMLLGMITLYAFTFYFTQYLQLVEGLSPFAAGLWFIPMAATTIAAAMAAPLIARRYPPPRVIAAGLVIAAGGFVMLAVIDAGSGLSMMIAGGIVIAVGINPLLVLSTDLIVGSAPPDRTGSAAALQETSGELGAALGIAVFGTLGTAVYSARMAGMPLDGLSSAGAETARDGFAGAFALAAELPAAVGGALLTAAREAFVTGMNVVAAISAVVLLAIAVLTVVVLRGVRPVGSETESDDPA